MIPGLTLGQDKPAPRFPGDHSWAAKQEELAANRERGAGNAILEAARDRMARTPEGLKLAESEAKQKYEEAYKNIQTLSDVGSEAAQRQIAKVADLGANYRRLSDQLKEVEKDESKRISNLEKIRDLVREGQTGLVIGTGAMQTVVPGTQIFDANRPPRGIPSLFRRGFQNPYDALIPPSMQENLKPGMQVVGGEAVFVSPAESRQIEAPYKRCFPVAPELAPRRFGNSNALVVFVPLRQLLIARTE
jgi:hypothetical protein